MSRRPVLAVAGAALWLLSTAVLAGELPADRHDVGKSVTAAEAGGGSATWTSPGTVIAGMSALAAVVGGAIALVNVRNSVRWKRAELASAHLRELGSNEELVFASRALDWEAGLLVVPERLQPLLVDDDQKEIIEHYPPVLEKAMGVGLTLEEMQQDARLQLYRTAMDSLLSWMTLVRIGLERGLFDAADIEPVEYWLRKIDQKPYMVQFARAFGYESDLKTLHWYFNIGSQS